MRHAIKKISILIFLFFAALSVFARDITVTVIDSDLDLPLEGATVRGWDGKEYICDIDGKAVVQAPDGRQSSIQAAYPGYETGRIVVPAAGSSFTIALRLSGVMQGRELVVEASRPGTSETQTGRSVAVNTREIAQTAEIGVIEDVMSTIKLLPGVNYSGMFDAQPSIRGGYPGDMNASFDGFYVNNPYHWGGGFSMSTIKLLPGVSYTGLFDAQPSIRGGHPGDMSASFDGFYVSNPYHWGGGFSIFDPRMVQSAQLSHGVFSVRYGHTISGLLEITSKKPSATETQLELGVNTSAANFNLSFPFGRGGILFMGRVTYYDPVIALAKELAKVIPILEAVNFIKVAPYIRSTTVSGNYRFTDNLELSATGFWGMDGISVYFLNTSSTDSLESDSSANFTYTNFQGFLTTALVWNPRADMLLKLTIGTGYEDAIVDGNMTYRIHNKYFSQSFTDTFAPFLAITGQDPEKYMYSQDALMDQSDFIYNAQARIDYDWELANNLLLAAGVQEMFSFSRSSGDQQMSRDIRFDSLENEFEKQKIRDTLFPIQPADNLIIEMPTVYSPDSQNRLLTTSAYVLGEYSLFSNRMKTELGLRLDHFVLFGEGFTIESEPVLNPRLNIDFNILKNTGPFVSFDISAATGLFSSVNSIVFSAEEKYNFDYMKPNRSWTSVLGLKFQFPESISINIEGYYKYVFNRMYVPVGLGESVDIDPKFDGEGNVWGIDVMLHKVQSRFWDGWISYSYNWAKYRDPGGKSGGVLGIDGGDRGDDWYFPSFHRFHTLNLVLNIRPMQFMNIYVRFGLASGVQLSRRVGEGPESYPVLVYDRNDTNDSYFIEKYYWPSVRDEDNRTTPSLPMDIKFSIFGNSSNGKSRYEVYVAVENVLSLLYSAEGNTSFNQYTGEIDEGSSSASYEIPIPIPSFGFKISY